MIRETFVAVAAAGLLWSCSEGVPMPPVQGGVQGPEFEAADLRVEAVPDIVATPIDLAATPAGVVTVGRYELTAWDDAYALELEMHVRPEEGSAQSAAVAAMAETDGSVTVDAAQLQRAYTEAVSRSPEQRTVYVDYTARATKPGTTYVLGGSDYRYGGYELTITPAPPGYVIEEQYYMLSDATRWTEGEPLALSHSEVNQYDDPWFSCRVNISATEAAEGFGWVIVSKSALQRAQRGEPYTALGGTAMSGILSELSDGEGHGTVTTEGPMEFRFNLEEMTYSIHTAYDALYTPGPANDWTQSASQRLVTDDYTRYRGLADLEFAFRLTATTDWSRAWGAGAEPGTIDPASTDNLPVEHNGLNYIEADLSTLRYSVTPIEGASLSGGAILEGGELTPDDRHPLRLRGIARMHAWGTWVVKIGPATLGGCADGGLRFDAPAATAPGDGAWSVTLNLDQYPYTIDFKKL